MKIIFLYKYGATPELITQTFHASANPRIGEEVELLDAGSGNTLRFVVTNVRWQFIDMFGNECVPCVGIALGSPTAVFSSDSPHTAEPEVANLPDNPPVETKHFASSAQPGVE